MEKRAKQLSTLGKQDTSTNSREAAGNESGEQGPRLKYHKGEKFEPGARGGMKGLPHTSGMIKMRGEMMNLTAVSDLNSFPAWFLHLVSSEWPAAIHLLSALLQVGV